MKILVLDGDSLTLEKAWAALDPAVSIRVSKTSQQNIRRARKTVEKALREQTPVYGITTGFGALSAVVISPSQQRQLQKNILMSHAAGVGAPFPNDIVRLIMLLVANGKAKGYSGIRPATLETFLQLFNAGIYPRVPEQGSVGASGDLAPLAHLALVLIGRGKAWRQGKWMSGGAALKQAGIAPVTLAEGEGLALVNGTQVMTALGAWVLRQSLELAKLSDIAASMSLEVLLGARTQFHERIHKIRPHPGQTDSAANFRRITRGSEIISSHKDCEKIQDAYSLRCSPQVHGASRDVFQFARRTIEIEMNSATENPLVFPDGKILSGGNFHGQPVALSMDAVGIALAELANISERRVERMVNPDLSGLPSFLIKEGGLNSGFMIAQYTAAALVSENKILAHPASVDSIPTSANKEDHVSMGCIAARKARDILANAKNVLAIELLCAAQALDLFTNLKPGRGTLAAYRVLRKHVAHMDRDRELSPDIEKAAQLIDNGEIVNAVEKAAGNLL